MRVTVLLLAIQLEVMERIIASAATRYYQQQRRLNLPKKAFGDLEKEREVHCIGERKKDDTIIRKNHMLCKL